jgi:hypothetical protein
MHHEFEIDNVEVEIKTVVNVVGGGKENGHKEEQEEPVRDTEEE